MSQLTRILLQTPAAIFLVVPVIMTACSGSAEEGVAENLVPPEHLHGSAWLVTAYENSEGELVDILEDTEITASFSQETVDDGVVYGFTGCNDYHGDYSVSVDNKVWPGTDLVLTTQNSCSDEIMKQEEEFITALIFGRKWQIDGLEMIFTKYKVQ